MLSQATPGAAAHGPVALNPTALAPLFLVTLPWANNCDPSEDEGTYSEYVRAADEIEARRLVALDMIAQSKGFPSPDEPGYQAAVDEFVEDRVSGWAEVVEVAKSVASDLSFLFEHELFPDGVRRDIDMDALKALLVANRDTLVVRNPDSAGMRGPAVQPATLFRVGLRVRTLHGERDTDETGQDRVTPPGAWGVIANHNHAKHWDVVFDGGGWVVLTEAEMLDPKHYQLETTPTAGP